MPGIGDFVFGSNEVGNTLSELRKRLEELGPSGLSQFERQNLLAGKKRNILKRSRTRSARSSASLARRSGGVSQPQILMRMLTEIGNQAAGDVNQAESDILGKSLALGRDEKAQLMALIAQLSQAQDAKGGFLEGLLETGGQAAGTYAGIKLARP